MIEKKFTLGRQEYPCSLSQPLSEPFVLLHGWGMGSNSWQPLISQLQAIAAVITLDLPGFGESEHIPEFSLEPVIELIVAELPESCALIGWSLGGMLAVQIAARYPKKIVRIVTLAANAKFVACRDYRAAMPSAVNHQFNKSFSSDPGATLKLFGGLLAQGDDNERALLKQLRTLIRPAAINTNWLQALELLAILDNRQAFANLVQPGLHIFAEKDSLVPASAAQTLKVINSQQKVVLVNGAAHAVHWSQPEIVIKEISEFARSFSVASEVPVLDKRQVAHSFSRAAATYDSVASLQRNVGEALLQKMAADVAAQTVIDLGCGTGYFTPQLQRKFPQALVAGVDIAEGMLQFARAHHEAQTYWLCSDAEFLPFADESIDLIYSNFALQWCGNLPRLFAELRRILKPGGELLFTTLGPATLHELKSAWRSVDKRVHVNEFHEQEVLLTQLRQQGFSLVEMERKPEVMEFEHISDLTRSLKALGAQNVNRGRLTGLTGRKTIQAFKQSYEKFRRGKMLPATYEVFYLKAKP